MRVSEKFVFLFLAQVLLLGEYAEGGELAAPVPLDLKPQMATVREIDAEMRAGPGNDTPFVGYVAGAVSVSFNSSEEENGWVPARPIDFQQRAWMRRSDLVTAGDLQPWTGEWPLRFVYFESEVGNFVFVFPEDGRCNQAVLAGSKSAIREKIKNAGKMGGSFLTDQSFECKELWHSPGSHVYYPNPGGGEFIWFDAKRRVLRFYSSYATVELHGFKDGRVEAPDEYCPPDRSAVACRWTGLERQLKRRPVYPPPLAPWKTGPG